MLKSAPMEMYPLFTSDGLNLYFYALTAHLGHGEKRDVEGARCAGGR